MESQPKLRTLFSREELEAAVSRLAAEISRDYRDKCPLLIGVLKGSFIFMADLVRRLDFPLEVDFIALSSYGKDSHTSGKVEVVQDLQAVIEGREVLVVEDIVDTGLTTAFLLDYLRKKNPASIKVCALTDKPSQRQVPISIDYLGLTAPNKFLVGYGLDLNQKFRNLPEICFIEDGD
ncbi:MAG TPA: hypoxanthine phosphoribosyltransferase [Dehalococcoidia bacterium]|jgi:hypoxanthine phosphoribosyltransferase|nr:hypoxanthine phosphoribosyltransferase [Dehalococcoidia bacterium]